jgi:hypothetical protein
MIKQNIKTPILLAILLSIILPQILCAMDMPEILAMRDGDTIALMRTKALTKGEFWTVALLHMGDTLQVGADRIQMDEAPGKLAGILGDRYPIWLERTESTTEKTLLHRLASPNSGAALLALSDPNVASVIGRLVRDTLFTSENTRRYLLQTGKSLSGTILNQREITLDVLNEELRPPLSISVEIQDVGLSVKWNYSRWSGDPSDTVIGFHVYRLQGDTQELIGDDDLVWRNEKLKEITINDVWAPLDVLLIYEVRAVNFLGREGSGTRSAQTTLRDTKSPGSPLDLRVVEENGAILVSWRPPADLDLLNYQVERRVGNSGEFQALPEQTNSANRNWLRDADLVTGQQYFYQARAIDKAGNTSEYSNTANLQVKQGSRPLAPRDFRATLPESLNDSQPDHILLSWKPVIQDGISHLNLLRLNKNGSWDIFNTHDPLDSLSADAGEHIAGLSPGSQLYYRILAIDAIGREGIVAECSILLPDLTPPAPPAYLSVSRQSDGRQYLSWQPSPDSDIFRYGVIRRSVPSIDTLWVNADRQSMVNEIASEDGEVVYSLVSQDSAGNIGMAGNHAKAKIGDTFSPAAPENVIAAVVDAGIRIQWTFLGNAAQMSVLRSSRADGQFVEIGKVGLDQENLLDPNGETGDWYRVISIDSSGNKSKASRAVQAKLYRGVQK